MSDPRWDQLGDLLINYSTVTQKGERLLITMMEVDTFELVRAVHASAVRAGALPHVQFTSALLDRDLMMFGSDEQVGWIPEPEMTGMQWADVYVGLRGFRNPYEFAGLPARRISAHRQAMGTVSAERNAQTRWVLVRVPNEAFAQWAEMSHSELVSFFFDATLKDWSKEVERYRRLQEHFEAASKVQIVSGDTDLTFSTSGRHYLVGDGHYNMPDGEIYTSPVDASAEGYINFGFPGVYNGVRIEEIRLELVGGRVDRASSRTNEDLLHAILATDAGSNRIGEFGVGTNEGISRFVGDILYDEKIAGTIHLAIGRAYPECGGHNHSAVHWDMVKDLRASGRILLDGRPIFEDGQWLVNW
jgi:aminopeptidase